ncbi:MAG: sodium:solute symporter family protein [Pseudomonadota bacterium]
MNYGILSIVILYQLLTILGVAYYLMQKHRLYKGEKDSFTHAGHGLSVPAIAMTLALTVLGAVHIIGVFEKTWVLGAGVIWFSFASVILLCVVCLATGRWVRRLGIATVPELLERGYGLETRLTVSCVMIGSIFGIITLEAQGLGVLLFSMTGWSIPVGGAVGAGLGILYVIFAGMREISWLNIINAVVMYIALILAVIFIGFALPGNGYETAAQVHRDAGNARLLNPFGDVGVIFAFGIPIVIAIVFSQSTSQMLLQTAMSAKTEKTLLRSMWIAAPVNGMFAVLATLLALAAMSVPEFAELGSKVATTEMLVSLLPPWLSGLLLAAFAGVILSTFAMTALASSTLFATDIYKRLYRPDATDAQVTWATRIMIVILGSISAVLAGFMPPILSGVAWLLAWLTPVFWVVIFGLFWKRNQPVAITALIVSWILNSAWTFTPLPEWVGLVGVHNAYVTFLTGLVIMVVGILFFGGRPGMMKDETLIQQRPAAMSQAE